MPAWCPHRLGRGTGPPVSPPQPRGSFPHQESIASPPKTPPSPRSPHPKPLPHPKGRTAPPHHNPYSPPPHSSLPPPLSPRAPHRREIWSQTRGRGRWLAANRGAGRRSAATAASPTAGPAGPPHPPPPPAPPRRTAPARRGGRWEMQSGGPAPGERGGRNGGAWQANTPGFRLPPRPQFITSFAAPEAKAASGKGKQSERRELLSALPPRHNHSSNRRFPALRKAQGKEGFSILFSRYPGYE